ncbi:hypothetical protein V1477_009546 [Vespula maculifrons]|uniref:Uncharacterized protein n=3 Tax=Vespula TaxID=7451 RepID=A0A834N905_VESGE|nr:hypothetical protein HZH68_007926 [Vespula germanica]KAF7423329.1 hypothetical protein H0235_008612 [Vespula pensylvanica]
MIVGYNWPPVIIITIIALINTEGELNGSGNDANGGGFDAPATNTCGGGCDSGGDEDGGGEEEDSSGGNDDTTFSTSCWTSR